MSKFKVGNRVRVREDLNSSTCYNDLVFSPLMSKYRGHVYTIDKVMNSPSMYKLKGNDDINTWTFSEDMLESAEFTKDDLKNGMIVEYRNGKRRMVLGTNLIGLDGINQFEYYHDDLTVTENFTTLDIVKVFDVPNLECKITDILKPNKSRLSLLWEREEEVKEEVKEITMDDIEEKFGCKVKIINNKEEK